MINLLLRSLIRREATSPEPLPSGVSVRVGRLIPLLGGLFSGMRGPAAAVTLGRTIVVDPTVPLDARLIRHELAHVRQWQEHPVTFPLRYVLNHVRYGYYDNPYEIEARVAERAEP
jgi:hypothetical protein